VRFSRWPVAKPDRAQLAALPIPRVSVAMTLLIAVLAPEASKAFTAAECISASNAAAACTKSCRIGPRCHVGPDWSECLAGVIAESGACGDRCFAQSRTICNNVTPSSNRASSTPRQLPLARLPTQTDTFAVPKKFVSERVPLVATTKPKRNGSALPAAETADASKVKVSASVRRSGTGGAMRPAATGATVEGHDSGTSVTPNVTASTSAQGGCTEPGAGGTVSVPCSILGIYPPSNPQYFLLPGAQNSKSIVSVDPSIAELYNATSAVQIFSSGADCGFRRSRPPIPIGSRPPIPI
jgi:hypothetical protein